jgi:histidinol-phosphatase (PHP family)
MPMPPWYDAPWRMSEEELDLYIDLLEALRRDYAGRLEIRIGLEADYHPGTEGFVERVLGLYPWDYIIGSVHYLGAWGLDNPAYAAEYEARELAGIYRDYFTLCAQAAETGLFHSVGHLDLPKKFGHVLPDGGLELARPALARMAACGVALDLNTAGWRKPVQQAYPHPSLLAAARELGLGVVLGSDAHKPAEVGHRFADALALAQSAGYRERLEFRAGQPLAVLL